MSLQNFSRDIVPILQLLVSFLGLISFLLLWWQIRQTTLWNKLKAQQTFLSHTTLKLEEEAQQAAKEAGVIVKARVEPLTNDEVQKIWNHDKAYHALMRLLNDLETTCTAIHAGVVDPDIAYSSHGIRITHYHKVYLPVIKTLKKHYENDDILAEFDKLAEEWNRRRELTERKRRWTGRVTKKV